MSCFVSNAGMSLSSVVFLGEFNFIYTGTMNNGYPYTKCQGILNTLSSWLTLGLHACTIVLDWGLLPGTPAKSCTSGTFRFNQFATAIQTALNNPNTNTQTFAFYLPLNDKLMYVVGQTNDKGVTGGGLLADGLITYDTTTGVPILFYGLK